MRTNCPKLHRKRNARRNRKIASAPQLWNIRSHSSVLSWAIQRTKGHEWLKARSAHHSMPVHRWQLSRGKLNWSFSFWFSYISNVFSLHFSIQIEVLNARQLVPTCTNGSCDPFVRVQFSPEEKFGITTKYKTNVHNKTLCPLFDEKFVM